MKAMALIALTAALATSTIAQAQDSPWRAKQRAHVAAKLDRGLAGTPLRGLGRLLEDVGYRYHLHPAFIAAAAGTESSYGAVPCCGQKYNLWGYYGMRMVSSWREAFTVYAQFIKSHWPRARTPWDLPGYCGCGTTAWGNATSRFMARLGFKATLRYPA